MTTGHDLERRVAEFYATEDRLRAPDRLLLQALATIETTRQRRELGLVPRRFQPMNTYAKLAVAAVAVLAVGTLGLSVLNPGPQPSVGGSSPSPSARPSPSPSPAASQGQGAAPPLDATFTSAAHGLSISYPAMWTEVPTTDAASTAAPGFLAPASDYLHDPTQFARLFLELRSEALDDRPGEEWATGVFSDPDEGCQGDRGPITVDGAPGLICDTLALTWSGDRGYLIRLYVSGDDPSVSDTYDRAWFDDVLATVRLPR